MSYKSLLVHLDTSQAAQRRLEFAFRLAQRFDARLSAILTLTRPEIGSFYVMAGSAEFLAEHERVSQEQRELLERAFKAEAARTGVQGDWRVTTAYANEVVPAAARFADLVIAGQFDPNDPESLVANQFLEHLILDSGRPVLVVPYVGTFASFGTHVVLAWDQSREAARAVADALPIVRTAKQTTIVTLGAPGGEPPGSRLPGADIAAVIARHGAAVAVDEMAATSAGAVGEALLSHAADLSADLLVMGCYGHARWRELVLGGASRTVLRSMTIPVLMSH
ncbi:universal stress protein UspA [Trinickia dabaoshanensis]|uniref:Universal stress protein UspA n=1 Tax=Trinickia dabaoshanensis TaxID=564714 RepID=A0A2N7VJ71_9BURK|nr:universal stress protein [Trinickia dabaoshanensis]PMS17209.1 universal stress protein UspA [Trinickia dabaoshanensis]